MRRAFIMVMLAAALGLFAQSADELMQYYNSAESQVGRLEMLRAYVAENSPGSADFYARALTELLADYPNVRGNQETAAANEIAQILSNQLGDAGYAASAPDLGRLVEALTDPLARGAALVALGKMHGESGNYYLTQTVRILTDLNSLPPTQDRPTGERLAWRAIIALENYQDPSGYLPVFFAAQRDTSWYTDEVRNQAQTSLQKISQDPSDYLAGVIRSDSYGIDIKHLALRALNGSTAPGNKKAEGALAAFAEGWRIRPSTEQQRRNTNEFRKYAMQILFQQGTGDAAVIALLDRSFKEGYDQQERFAAVNVLAGLAAGGHLVEQSVGQLSGYLLALNQKCADGDLRQADEATVRVVIPALGNTRQQSAIRALNTVRAVSWTGTVKRLAQTAITNITQNPAPAAAPQ